MNKEELINCFNPQLQNKKFDGVNLYYYIRDYQPEMEKWEIPTLIPTDLFKCELNNNEIPSDYFKDLYFVKFTENGLMSIFRQIGKSKFTND